ncbi:MAG: hypothetical protein KatS3mg105_2091 [Gemmatales bacterium]|nr:MAG: hypothetical protein KatS3mg105_2091 [Gemmatales bacterium]
MTWNKNPKIVVPLAVVAVVLLVGSAFWYNLFGFGRRYENLLLHTVHYEKLDVTIVERGTLEAASNADIICEVKAGTKGSSVATTIKWVIPDGSQVKKGDKLVELDDSGLREQLKDQKNIVLNAKAASIQAEKNFEIVKSQNESDIEAARVQLQLAILDLDKYLGVRQAEPSDVPALICYSPGIPACLLAWPAWQEIRPREGGEYAQLRKDINGRILMAKSDLGMWIERAAWSQRMSKREYVTASQAQADMARRQSALLALQKVEEELRVLEKFTHARTKTELESKVAEAVRNLFRTMEQAEAKRVQAEADWFAKRAIYEQEVKRYEEIEAEIAKCTIHAPRDGLVVYYVPQQSRRGIGSNQSIIAQGEPVMERQKLMQIPDLTKMIVDTKIHEALISRIPQDVKLPAVIRVDAFPDRTFRGHVMSVATVASQAHWLMSDVKVYEAKVAIDDPVVDLKPGMTAEVTIFAQSGVERALTVPVQAVVGSVEMGAKRKCFVMTPTGPVEREITLGLSNDRMVEVRSGLQQGEQVVLNPRQLVGDKIPVGQPKRKAFNKQEFERKRGPSQMPLSNEADASQNKMRPMLQQPRREKFGERKGAGKEQFQKSETSR